MGSREFNPSIKSQRTPWNPDRPFRSKHGGRCCQCGNEYPKGATIRKWNGKYAHAGCTKGRKPPPVSAEPKKPKPKKPKGNTFEVRDVITGETWTETTRR